MAGTTLQVEDFTEKPATARIVLRTRSTIAAALGLIDLPPLGITSAAGLATDLAEGSAAMETHLSLPLVKGLEPGDVSYRVTGALSDVVSDRLVPGRRFEAKRLDLGASGDDVRISGAAQLEGVPLRGAWTMVPGADGAGRSRVEGTLELSQALSERFGIGLPENSVSGRTAGRFTVELAPEAPPLFSLESNLVGLGVRVPGLGWSKSEAAAGALELAGRLGSSPAVERLTVSAPGLSIEGSVALTEGGGLEAARLSRVRLGGWLDASAVLSGRGAAQGAGIAITGGTADLRETTLAGTGGAGGVGAVDVRLDRLILSDGIVLTGVRGRLSGQGGLSGRLSADLEGGGPVMATLAPAAGGTAVRVRAEDAGAALRGAGVYRRASGGALDLVLQPVGAPGRYDGRLRIDGLRVRGTPVLAELLSAISVVGIADLLDGEGLMFSDLDAEFRLVPGVIEVKRASAIGPSLGISMAGVYDTRGRRVDMQGVISPIYMLNSIGSVLTRRGEGLFGFNYRLSGDARAPEVRVNPLSIFTPGMFREIFRGPPPRVQSRQGTGDEE
ncbi:MAG: AsmA-like C-terminal region-containing protein [Rhodovulum sp.]